MFPIMLLEDYHDRIKGGTLKQMRAAGSPYVPVCIPLEMIAAHEPQALSNHWQSIARLAERGGLSADEAVAILEDRRWRKMSIVEANETLCRLMAAWIDKEARAAKAETVGHDHQPVRGARV